MRASLIAVFVMLAIASPVRGEPLIRGQGSQTLEVPRQREQQGIPQSPAVIPGPSQDVLVIPQASRDFVGEWGGHLRLENVIGIGGRLQPPSVSIVSLKFGESKGDVFMRTTAFANPASRIVSTKAQVVNPHKVVVQLDGIELGRVPIRHVEKISLALIGKDRMDCLKWVDFYAPGYDQPIASIDYHGVLRIISDAERLELEREVLEHGEVPQGTIESHRRFER